MALTAGKRGVVRRKTGAKARGRVALYVLSDSTGNLANHMVAAFMTQFPEGAFELRAVRFVKKEGLAKVFAGIGKGSAVMHAVVLPALKKRIESECRKRGVRCHDLTGGSVAFLARVSGVKPGEDHSRLHLTDEMYHRRIKAIEFAIEHDDGLGTGTLHEADIVLAGVSRTGKTPTSIFLAQLGYRVANVSLAMGVTPPAELETLPKGKLIGLTIDPDRLVEIRKTRQAEWGHASTAYDQRATVEREVVWSRRLFAKWNCPTLDVTNHAVEETAGRIVAALGLGQPEGASEESL